MPGFNFFREPLILDDTTRASLPGQFVTLPDGVTHYELAGPEGRTPVVFIHGFSTPYMLWDHNFGALAEAGLRVLRYDLLGRGYSDRPKVTYDADLFDRQLLGLLDALGMTDPVDLVGCSMGGLIAVTFADRHPERVRRLSLISPAGFPIKPTLAALLLFVPGLGELILALTGNKVILDGLARDFYRPERVPEYVEKYRAQLPYGGFKRAILSTMRHMPLTGMAETYARVGRQGRPVQLLWGRHDQTIPFETHEKVRAAIPHLDFHAVDDAGHIAQYERPEVVNRLLIGFLKA